MGTVIADRFWTEAPELHIVITYEGPAAPPLGKYLVTRFAGCTPDGIWVGYGSAGRATEAEAREFANGMWTWTVELIKQNRAAKAQTDPFTVVGETVVEVVEAEPFKFEDAQLHEVGGNIFKINISKSSGHPYAMSLDSMPQEKAKPTWSYAPGAINELGAGTLMSTERRAEIGRIMVHCLDCGARLTHPISVKRGIGPVCSGLGYAE
jgi:hypothetical protein